MPTNDNPPTAEELAEWKRLCAAATEGPWEFCFYAADPDGDGILRQVGQRKGFLGCLHSNDGGFLAASRTAMPRLLAEVRRLRKGLQKMLSAEMDWEDGAVGVGYEFRLIARDLLGDGGEAGR